jgi:hypothetical protein
LVKKYLIYLLFLLFSFSWQSAAKAQDINGVWTGNFIEYIHNTYDVKLTVEKLAPGNIFNAKLLITNGYYFGEYNVSGFICNKQNLEITTIVLMKENEAGNWIDCLNGTFDLNADETQLTFTDTWLSQSERNNACKVKYIQKDMFQCLRSAFLHKAKYLEEIASFDKTWQENEYKLKKPVYALNALTKKDTVAGIKKDDKTLAVQEKENIKETSLVAVNLPEEIKDKTKKSETKIVAKNEDRAPVIDTFERVKMRPVYVKDEIEVSSADITIEYWDRYTEDGDSINLYINKKPILQNQLLTKAKKSINIHLDKTKNYLVLDAINLGTEPPNTASITVKDGKKIQNVSLTSTMKTSGALKIVVRK